MAIAPAQTYIQMLATQNTTVAAIMAGPAPPRAANVAMKAEALDRRKFTHTAGSKTLGNHNVFLYKASPLDR